MFVFLCICVGVSDCMCVCVCLCICIGMSECLCVCGCERVNVYPVLHVPLILNIGLFPLFSQLSDKDHYKGVEI